MKAGTILQILSRSFVFGACLLFCSAASAQITTLLDDPFDSFDLGTTWQAHADGVPDVSVAFVAPSPFLQVLQLHSDNVADEVRGVETISPISLTGLTNITVDVRLRPINQGINGTVSSAEVALLGSSGDFIRAFSSNNVGPTLDDQIDDWADFYADSKGNEARTDAFVHCFAGGCDSVRRLVVTAYDSGSLFEVQHQDDTLVEQFFSDFTISDLGSDLTIALRQETVDGADEVIGWFDSILVTTDANFVPPVPPSADYNDDGVVNLADYTVWRDTLGSTTDLRADGDGSLSIDQGDYDFWKSDFGTIVNNGSGTVVSATVPEPSTYLVLLSLVGGVFLGRRTVLSRLR